MPMTTSGGTMNRLYASRNVTTNNATPPQNTSKPKRVPNTSRWGGGLDAWKPDSIGPSVVSSMWMREAVERTSLVTTLWAYGFVHFDRQTPGLNSAERTSMTSAPHGAGPRATAGFDARAVAIRPCRCDLGILTPTVALLSTRGHAASRLDPISTTISLCEAEARWSSARPPCAAALRIRST